MKPAFLNVLKKIGASVAPLQNLVLISLAAWATHIILRVLLLFRSNPYGFPFVSNEYDFFDLADLDPLDIENGIYLVSDAAMTDLIRKGDSDSIEKILRDFALDAFG